MNLEQATESTFAKAMTRFGMPLMLGVIGTLGMLVLSDIRTDLASVKSQQTKTDSKVDVLNAKLDNGVIWRITELERRLNTVEQAQKTP